MEKQRARENVQRLEKALVAEQQVRQKEAKQAKEEKEASRQEIERLHLEKQRARENVQRALVAEQQAREEEAEQMRNNIQKISNALSLEEEMSRAKFTLFETVTSLFITSLLQLCVRRARTLCILYGG